MTTKGVFERFDTLSENLSYTLIIGKYKKSKTAKSIEKL